jgi:hypothetical protein
VTRVPSDLFPTDDPIVAAEMIGRASDVAEMAARLSAARINVVLVGPRRTGKTTVCRAVVERVEPDYYVAALDLFLLSRVEQIADAIVEASFANRPLLRKALHNAKQTGRSVLEALSLGVAAKSPGLELEGLEISLLPQLKHDPDRYLDYALRLPQKIAQADQRQLLLFIDEFQDIIRIGNSDFDGGADALTRKMRAIFQDSPNVVFLFAGSIEHMMRNLFGHREQAFFEFGSMLHLSPITPDEWLEGLAERFARGGYQIEPGALEEIVELGEGHPRSTMLLAQQSVLVAVLGGADRIDRRTVELALLEAMRSERSRHEGIVEHLQSLPGKGIRRSALPVALAIARDRPTEPVAGSEWQNTRTLKALRDAGITEGKGRDQTVISDPLFARYLRSVDVPTPFG